MMSAPAASAFPARSAACSGKNPARFAITTASPFFASWNPLENQYSGVRSVPNTQLSRPAFTLTKQGRTSGAGCATMVFVQIPATPDAEISRIVSPSLPCAPAGTISGFLKRTPQKWVVKSIAISPPLA